MMALFHETTKTAMIGTDSYKPDRGISPHSSERYVIERAIITSGGPALRLPETLEAVSIQPAPSLETPQFDSLAALERRHITQVLQATGGLGDPGAKPLHPALPEGVRFFLTTTL